MLHVAVVGRCIAANNCFLCLPLQYRILVSNQCDGSAWHYVTRLTDIIHSFIPFLLTAHRLIPYVQCECCVLPRCDVDDEWIILCKYGLNVLIEVDLILFPDSTWIIEMEFRKMEHHPSNILVRSIRYSQLRLLCINRSTAHPSNMNMNH